MGLSERAFMVSLQIRMPEFRKAAKREARDLDSQTGAARGTYSASKALLASGALDKMRNISNKARKDVDVRSLPWLRNGVNILPTELYMETVAIVSEAERQFWAIYQNDFRPSYPDLVQEAQARLNGAFDRSEYPSLRRLDHKFGWDWLVLPMPETGDWRARLSADEEQAIIEREAAKADAALDASAVKELYARLHDVVATLKTGLSEYTGKREGSFRDTLVTNIERLLDRMPALNVTDDAGLAAMAADVRAMLSVPDVLRQSETLRESKIEQAEKLLAGMAGYLD